MPVGIGDEVDILREFSGEEGIRSVFDKFGGAPADREDRRWMEQAKPQLRSVVYCNSAYGAAKGADTVVIATECVPRA